MQCTVLIMGCFPLTDAHCFVKLDAIGQSCDVVI